MCIRDRLKGESVGEAIVTFQINNTEVTQEVAFTVVPKEGELEILHAPIPDVQDFPDLSMLTGAVNTDKVRAYETKLGLRIYESTRWDEYAHLYVTSKEKVSQTNFNRCLLYTSIRHLLIYDVFLQKLEAIDEFVEVAGNLYRLVKAYLIPSKLDISLFVNNLLALYDIVEE